MSSDFAATQPADDLVSGRPGASVQPVATLLVVVLMLGMTAAACYLSNSITEISNDALVKLGGNLPQATLEHYGQWRLLAAKLQLKSWLNAAVFLPFFWLVATAFEKRDGSWALIVIFVLSSLVTGAATLYLMNDEGRVSVGGGGPALCFLTCLFATSMLEGTLKQGFF